MKNKLFLIIILLLIVLPFANASTIMGFNINAETVKSISHSASSVGFIQGIINWFKALFSNSSNANPSSEKILNCTDGTLYGECSKEQPYFCFNGTLLKNSTACGCPEEQVLQGNGCVSKYGALSKEQTFNYTLRGNSANIKFALSSELNSYLASLPREIEYTLGESEPTDKDFIMKKLDNSKQKTGLEPFVEKIKNITPIKDDQVRIAISIVQNIAYNQEGVRTNASNDKYPYEVLYDKTGVCEEKSELLAFILRDMGYGVVLFEYKTENHMALGIKCPLQYSYKNSSYCFVESSVSSIITDSEENYAGAGKLSSPSEIIAINDGISFDTVSEEYNDNQEWQRIAKLVGPLNEPDYNQWTSLVNKYGLQIG